MSLVRPWLRSVARIGSAGTRLVFPIRCAHCDADLSEENSRELLCGVCCRALNPVNHPRCGQCAAIRGDDGEPSATCHLCGRSALKFDAAIVLNSYEGPLRRAVLQMKRPSGEILASAVGRFLGGQRVDELAAVKADVVVPVPMHWTRKLWRGTNSAEVLAGCLRTQLGLPVWRRRVVRRRKTLPQADLKPRERFQNVRGAFSIRRARGVPRSTSPIG